MKVSPFHVPRVTVLTLCLLLSIAVMGLLGDLTRKGSKAHLHLPHFDILGLVVSAISIIVFSMMLFGPRYFSVLKELIITFIMFVLWVVTAALIIQGRHSAFGHGGCGGFAPLTKTCNELTAAEGISVTIFVLLLIYMLWLFTYAHRAHGRYNNRGIWQQRMNERGTTTHAAVPAMATATGPPASAAPSTTV